MTLLFSLNLGMAWGDIAAVPESVLKDLTWLFAQYVPDLAEAHSGADDAVTQIAKDVATVRAGASTELDDLNTAYATYLSGIY